MALFDSLPEFTNRFLMLCLDVRDASVRHLMLRLADEARHPGFASQILVERSEEHTSELQSLMRISYAVFCLKKKKKQYDSRDITVQPDTIRVNTKVVTINILIYKCRN